MNNLEWVLLTERTYDFLAADKNGLFHDLAPEIKRRLYAADPYQHLRRQQEESMTIKVKSGKPIETATLDKIKTIFNESHCPNESLLLSITDFTGYDGASIVQLATGDKYTATIEVR